MIAKNLYGGRKRAEPSSHGGQQRLGAGLDKVATCTISQLRQGWLVKATVNGSKTRSCKAVSVT